MFGQVEGTPKRNWSRGYPSSRVALGARPTAAGGNCMTTQLRCLLKSENKTKAFAEDNRKSERDSVHMDLRIPLGSAF